MGQYYVHSGQKDHATQEFSVYQQLQAKRQADIDKEGAEVEQFIYSVKHDSGSKP
jgi:hypothetical protein